MPYGQLQHGFTFRKRGAGGQCRVLILLQQDQVVTCIQFFRADNVIEFDQQCRVNAVLAAQAAQAFPKRDRLCDQCSAQPVQTGDDKLVASENVLAGHVIGSHDIGHGDIEADGNIPTGIARLDDVNRAGGGSGGLGRYGSG